ncbi:hypothetical protein BH09MYX1_BH09MYX1_35310 [soil metagenome]
MTGRRRALKILLGTGCAALGLAVLAPPLAYVVARPPGAGGSERWVRTILLAELAPGTPRRVAIIADRHAAWTTERAVELGSVWITRRGDDVVVLSASCPHLGCTIGAAGDGTGFVCPCHDSSFSVDGKRDHGPSPRDMDPLAARVVDGFVEVSFKEFRPGTEERVEIA